MEVVWWFVGVLGIFLAIMAEVTYQLRGIKSAFCCGYELYLFSLCRAESDPRYPSRRNFRVSELCMSVCHEVPCISNYKDAMGV